ncbi:hypothetical protein QAD02_004284 [Eretmocerus hayati]|uniref:Uncharacterized protein n=1 Tax=Eretmocerus hayati TaxID=131215 RepID=A0ACC2NQD0_9HYME|nr:hypothetical protein QAD02_004284 [Eretmocerus hayati]
MPKRKYEADDYEKLLREKQQLQQRLELLEEDELTPGEFSLDGSSHNSAAADSSPEPSDDEDTELLGFEDGKSSSWHQNNKRWQGKSGNSKDFQGFQERTIRFRRNHQDSKRPQDQKPKSQPKQKDN